MIKKDIINMLDDTIFCNKELCKYNLRLENEVEIYKKALELACKDLTLYQGVATSKLKIEIVINHFIEQAKGNIK